MKKLLVIIILLNLNGCSFDQTGIDQGEYIAQLCANYNCANDALCIVSLDDNNAYIVECRCQNNWSGDHCDICADGYEEENGQCVAVQDPCLNMNCNHGYCENDHGEAVCICEDNYQGKFCDQCPDGYLLYEGYCIENPCNNLNCGDYGNCEFDMQTYSAYCQCDASHIGEYCDQCNSLAGYVDHNGNCELNPCLEEDCNGNGICELDQRDWLPVCNCNSSFVGSYCEYNKSDLLIFKNNNDDLLIQVKNPLWGEFTATMKLQFEGEVSALSNIYYNQVSVDEDGFIHINPCMAGLSEKVKFMISESPYDLDHTLSFTNDSTSISFDPEGFVYTDPSDQLNKFRVECTCDASGICDFIPDGN